MLHKIFKPNGKRALTHIGLTKYWNESGHDEDYDISRIDGQHCSCEGATSFELLPRDSEYVIEGGKDYMVCKTCGEYSHL